MNGMDGIPRVTPGATQRYRKNAQKHGQIDERGALSIEQPHDAEHLVEYEENDSFDRFARRFQQHHQSQPRFQQDEMSGDAELEMVEETTGVVKEKLSSQELVDLSKADEFATAEHKSLLVDIKV